jgi:hypothetical protein
VTVRRVSKREQKAPDQYGGSEKNAWITPAKKKTTRIKKGLSNFEWECWILVRLRAAELLN